MNTGGIMVNKFYSVDFTAPFIDQFSHAINISMNEDGEVVAKIDRLVDIKLTVIKFESFEKYDHLIIDFSGEIKDIFFSKNNPSSPCVAVDVDGYHINIEVNHGAMSNYSKDNGSKKDKNKIISPFHSKVVEVLIHQGDIVEENQPLIRLESMKVISTFTAPYQSRIVDVFTSEGQSVETGSILIYLEPITAIQ